MAPSLTSCSYLLVTSDVIGMGWDYPIYCRVVKMGPRIIKIEGLHDAAGHTWLIKRSSAAQCTVTTKEARTKSPGPLLRQAVMVEHAGALHYDQVMEVDGNQATVQLLDESVVTPTDHIAIVAPVVALILEAVSFETSEWNIDELVEMQHTILDRISGASSLDGSNEISVILEDLIDVAYYPNPKGSISWIDPLNILPSTTCHLSRTSPLSGRYLRLLRRVQSLGGVREFVE
ncbi:hypothetical protein V7S43_012531 [Phytophthora oleae]|uniref:Uncharacterized protein n=1 Tax=Phytophthora oleae TaxID=2107226 RepID=A0ABD3EPS1_9STRA